MSPGALAAIFGSSFLVSLTGALSPGPLTTLAVREGARRGFWAGPLLAVGHGAIELVLVIGVAKGLDRALDEEEAAIAIAWVGGLFLLWLGWRTLSTAPGRELRIGDPNIREGEPHLKAPLAISALPLVVAGVAVSISNPFWVVWWATVGTAYIAESLEQGVAGLASFYSAHILTDLAWLSFVAFLLASGRRFLSSRAYKWVLTACGIFLLALGGWFLASGLGYIF